MRCNSKVNEEHKGLGWKFSQTLKLFSSLSIEWDLKNHANDKIFTLTD